jgi:hypothetical protein
MNAVEQFRQAILPFHKYAKWILLFGFVAWLLILVIEIQSGQIHISTWVVLAYLVLAWLIYISGNKVKQG